MNLAAPSLMKLNTQSEDVYQSYTSRRLPANKL